MSDDTLAAVRRAKQRFQDMDLKDLDVIEVGIGLHGSVPALKVNLRSEPATRDNLPHDIDGVPIIYDVVGAIRSREAL